MEDEALQLRVWNFNDSEDAAHARAINVSAFNEMETFGLYSHAMGLLCTKTDKVLALLSFNLEDKDIDVSYLEVLDSHRKLGLGSRVLVGLFHYAATEVYEGDGYTVQISVNGYSESGAHMDRMLRDLDQKTPHVNYVHIPTREL